jgi:aldehyde dehydrogenase (NAD+)
MLARNQQSSLFIAGAWRAAQDGAALPVEDPSTGEIVGELAEATASDVDDAVAAARASFTGTWGRATAAERGRVLAKIGGLVAENAEDLAQIEARDVGKPLTQARNDALALARYLEFYAGAADKFHGETLPYLADYTVYTLREPHGVTAHIIPWNYPMQIVGRSVVAALAAGNAAVLKPAEQASLSALAFARLAAEAGLPDGALNVVTGAGATGAALAGHPDVNHISFTGSASVGALVQSAAGAHAVPVTLELGGKSPQLVFADADLERAARFCVNAGIQNAGQTCSASSRILIQRDVFGAFVEKMAVRYRALRVGPALADYDLGPLITAEQQTAVTRYATLAGRDGTVVAEGAIANDAPKGGHYFAPVLISGLDAAHAAVREEIFGPLQVVLPFDSEDQAVALANATPFGLVAGAWTADGARQMRLARNLRAGQVFINNYGAGGGVELPFGGTGRSGHGREKGFEALYGFTRLKTVAAWHGRE